ncbi:MAG: hypothetical protein U0R51_13460 [Solirubrobacterales bacterium]
MSAVELGAAALIVLAIVVCVGAVVVSAADAGRIVAQRLAERAESRAGHGGPVAPGKGERSRDPHSRPALSERRPHRRR